MLSEQNIKLTKELTNKDAIIEGKSIEVDKINKQVKGLSDQLAGVKSSASERISHLEREIAMLKNEFEEGKLAKQRELEQQRATMQREVDQQNKNIEERDAKVSTLNAQLAKIKHDQEEESVNLGIFVSKSIDAISLATHTSSENGLYATFLIESQAEVGFSKLSIKSLLNGDISKTVKV